MNELLEAELREAFALQARKLSPESETHVTAIDYLAYSRKRRGFRTVLAASGTAVTGGVIAAAVLLTSGASVAYAGWSASPTTPSSATVASATHTCATAFSGTGTGEYAQGIVGQPVLTENRGIYTAVITVSDGKLYSCLTGGNEHNPQAGFDISDYVYGAVGSSPGADQISPLYAYVTGGSAGVAPPAWRRVWNQNKLTPTQQAEQQQSRAGGGYGDFALGQAGSDVTAVTITFTNGESVEATVENGWYFAWWPWVSDPTSVSVTTNSGANTSPVTVSSSPRLSFAPACQAGAAGCVFTGTDGSMTTTTTTGTNTNTNAS